MPADRLNLQDLGVLSSNPTTPPIAPLHALSLPTEGNPAPQRSYETPQFAFVPVGLSHANLAWVEDVIRRLKEKGDRQASRSKIIRALIERFGRQLENDLFKPNAHTTISPYNHES